MAIFARRATDDTVRDDLDRIRDSLGRLAAVLAERTGEEADRGLEKAGAAAGDLRGLVDTWLGGRREVMRGLDRTADHAHLKFEQANAALARHPMAAIGIAAIIGFALGLAASGRR